ncbi:MAG: Wzt carbohydrate-binding domain-containing protein [Candidatus Omnitrophica bacterium]|nr:Wzt carbohydrate-binding domain-containing protein [Candidatus Omnitrophota bacterium]
MTITKNTLKWWADTDEWGQVWGTREAEIASVKLLDSSGKIVDSIDSGADLTVKVDFYVREVIDSPHFGVAIFREDGLYCFGPNTVQDGFTIDSINKGAGWFSIKFKDIPLGSGRYKISAAIWDKKEILPYSYHAGGYEFTIRGHEKAHALNMPHRWSGKPSSEGGSMEADLGDFKKEIESTLIDISSVKTVNRFGIGRDVFKSREPMSLHIRLGLKRPIDGYCLRIAIVRRDAILCHIATTMLGGGRNITLTYPCISLLGGDYALSAGIFDRSNLKPLMVRNGLCGFKIVCRNNYHGLAYIGHTWDWSLP